MVRSICYDLAYNVHIPLQGKLKAHLPGLGFDRNSSSWAIQYTHLLHCMHQAKIFRLLKRGFYAFPAFSHNTRDLVWEDPLPITTEKTAENAENANGNSSWVEILTNSNCKQGWQFLWYSLWFSRKVVLKKKYNKIRHNSVTKRHNTDCSLKTFGLIL